MKSQFYNMHPTHLCASDPHHAKYGLWNLQPLIIICVYQPSYATHCRELDVSASTLTTPHTVVQIPRPVCGFRWSMHEVRWFSIKKVNWVIIGNCRSKVISGVITHGERKNFVLKFHVGVFTRHSGLRPVAYDLASRPKAFQRDCFSINWFWY